MPSELEVYAFPRLKSAKLEVNNADQFDYKSGASFSGSLDGVKRSGSGVFSWPSGDRYSGEYVENMRQGHGEQYWADGSQHVGSFEKDVRHGYGETRWKNGESYIGAYFKDHRHGEGVYSWSNGSTYQGTFYKDKKEGYGIFKFPSGKTFEGLYRDDERCGPGVMTYPDGNLDVGLWHKERLISFCSSTEGAFSLDDHDHIDYDREEHVTFVKNPRRKVCDKTSDPVRDCLSPEVGSGDASNSKREVAMDLDSNQNQKNANMTHLPYSGSQASIDLNTLTYDQEEYDGAFFGDDACDLEPNLEGDVRLSNNTPSYVRMQEHILVHKYREGAVSFPVSDILSGERGCNGDKGPIEESSEALITASGYGNHEAVNSLVIEGAVDVNVADRDGQTALLGAAVNMHRDIVNLLLDNGADVNKLNNEGLSALAACHVLFYPLEAFVYNIAERYLPQPSDGDLASGSPQEDRGGIVADMDNLNLEDGSQSSVTTWDLLSVSSHARSCTVSNNPSFSHIPDNFSSHDCIQGEGGDGGTEGGPGEDAVMNGVEDEGGRDDFFDVESHAVTEEVDTREEGEEVPDWDPEAAQSESRFCLAEDDGPHGVTPSCGPAETPFTGTESETESEDGRGTYSLPEFDSNTSLVNYRIPVTEEMIERCATVMSQNKGITSGRTSKCSDPTMDQARRRAIAKAEHAEMEATIRLLLKRGADPNASAVPMPVIFFAIKAADVDAVRVLLEKGTVTTCRLSKEKDGLVPLHIACALPGPEGVDITRLFLQAGADPNTRTLEEDDHQKIDFTVGPTSPMKMRPGLDMGVFALYEELQEKGNHRGGRTPLHIACSRDDNYELSRQVVRLLLEKGANPNVLCNGESPLSMATASGNDLAVDELLRFGADPSLPLGVQCGSALCVTTDTRYEFRRKPLQRIALIDKLVDNGANILAPIPVGSKMQMGTAVDYAYWMFNQDRRIAHMPYHALTNSERDTYNARKKLLSHLGGILRSAAIKRERERLAQEATEGVRSKSPAQGFLYIGAGAQPMPGSETVVPTQEGDDVSSSESKQIIFHSPSQEGNRSITRKPLLKYCYECGRILGVRLSACTRCKEVYYCSKACKVRGWNARHKEECLRVTGRSRSPSPHTKTSVDGKGRRRMSGNSSAGHTTREGGGIKSGRVMPDGGRGPGDKRRGSAQASGKRSLQGSSSRSKDGSRAPAMVTSHGSLGHSHGGSGGLQSSGKGSQRGRVGSSKVGLMGGSAGARRVGGNDDKLIDSQKDISENYSFN